MPSEYTTVAEPLIMVKDCQETEKPELKINTIKSLPVNCKNLLILDNGFVNYIQSQSNKHSQIDFESLFDAYDLVVITGWGKIELEDSRYRVDYINTIVLKHPEKFAIIREEDYGCLIKSDSGINTNSLVYHFFLFCH